MIVSGGSLLWSQLAMFDLYALPSLLGSVLAKAVNNSQLQHRQRLSLSKEPQFGHQYPEFNLPQAQLRIR
jgi:hypothetical protein